MTPEAPGIFRRAINVLSVFDLSYSVLFIPRPHSAHLSRRIFLAQ